MKPLNTWIHLTKTGNLKSTLPVETNGIGIRFSHQRLQLELGKYGLDERLSNSLMAIRRINRDAVYDGVMQCFQPEANTGNHVPIFLNS